MISPIIFRSLTLRIIHYILTVLFFLLRQKIVVSRFSLLRCIELTGWPATVLSDDSDNDVAERLSPECVSSHIAMSCAQWVSSLSNAKCDDANGNYHVCRTSTSCDCEEWLDPNDDFFLFSLVFFLYFIFITSHSSILFRVSLHFHWTLGAKKKIALHGEEDDVLHISLHLLNGRRRRRWNERNMM